MPTTKFVVVKVVLPDDSGFADAKDALEGLVEDHKMEWPDAEIGEWSVEGEWDSLEEIGESLFDIDAEPVDEPGSDSNNGTHGL